VIYVSSSLIFLIAQDHPEEGWIGTWSPGIGDPNFIGWLTVVAYLFASFLCLRVYRALAGTQRQGVEGYVAAVATVMVALVATRQRISALSSHERVRALWFSIALVLLFLGFNKQLDLQTALTEFGRIMARSEGWYGVRREIQVVFILGILLLGGWLLRTAAALAVGNIQQMRFVLTGVVFLLCFVAIRATSFHHVDRLLGLNFGGFRLNWLLELGGNALVILGAWRALRAARPRRTRVSVTRGNARP